jgi:hypothetical protein
MGSSGIFTVAPLEAEKMDSLNIDRDVRAVTDFVERSVAKPRRVGVLKAAVELSTVLWGDGDQETVTLMEEGPTSTKDQCDQS